MITSGPLELFRSFLLWPTLTGPSRVSPPGQDKPSDSRLQLAAPCSAQHLPIWQFLLSQGTPAAMLAATGNAKLRRHHGLVLLRLQLSEVLQTVMRLTKEIEMEWQ